ncbi:MAG: flagellar basal-body MS-ring/collar protein FliF [Desulfomicrobium sp.]|nr:flagellar basal-body MS-ring/collar protein FliF [Desulfomicrobium sp.]
MPPFLQSTLAKATDFWVDKSLAQRILLGGLLFSLFIAFFGMIFWMNKVDYRVLYSQLYQEDASSVVSYLQKEKIPYQITDSGGTIMVPSDMVYEARLKLAGEGSLHGQGIGFELFDENQIGQTNFVQGINYQRALQGELSRTISELSEVENARVHLVLPSKSLFVEEQAPPSAAIMLKLKGGRNLNAQQVQAIINLVSTSVEGMSTERITLADSRGKILYQPKSETDLTGLSSTQLEYQANMQRSLEQRIEQLLLPIVGPGRVIARVNADLDFNRTTIRKEIFDPKSAVVRSEVRNEEENKGTANVDGGVPDPNYQGENDRLASGTAQESIRTSSTTNFDINKEEQQIVSQVGSIKRLSVAVLVDGKYTQQQDGTYAFEPLNAEQMEQIRQLSQRAVGFDDTRGDAIEVSSISFGEPVGAEQAPLLDVASRYFQLLGKPLLNTLIILLFLLFVARPVVLALIRPKLDRPTVQTSGELGAAQELMALTEGLTDEDMAAVDAVKRIENAKHLAQQLVEQNLDQAVMIMRQWMTQGQGES